MSHDGTTEVSDRQNPTSPGFLSQIARSFGMRVMAAGLTFALGPLCARAVGLDGFGDYALAIFWTNVLVIVGKLGFDTASLRFIAQYRSQGETRLLQRFVQTARRQTLMMSLIVAMSLAGATFFLRESMTDGVYRCLLLASLLLPVIVGIQLREAGLLAFGRVITGQLNSVLTPLLLISFILTLPLLTGTPLTSRTIMLLHLSSAALTLGFLSLVSQNVMPRSEGEEPDRSEVRVADWMHVAMPLLLVQLLNLLQNQSGTGMCGALLGKESAALFAAVTRVAGVLFLGLLAINTIAAPRISSLYHSGRTAELERFLKQCAGASFAFSATFAVVMFISGRWVLGLYGDEFVSGYVPMLVMLGGLALASAAGPVTQLMLMTGRQWDCIKIFAVNVTLCLTLGFIIIPVYGVLGAAMTAALARVGSSVALVMFARYRLGLWCVVGRLPASPQSPPEAPRMAA